MTTLKESACQKKFIIMERDLLNRFDNVASLHMVLTHSSDNIDRLFSEKEDAKKPAKIRLFSPKKY